MTTPAPKKPLPRFHVCLVLVDKVSGETKSSTRCVEGHANSGDLFLSKVLAQVKRHLPTDAPVKVRVLRCVNVNAQG